MRTLYPRGARLPIVERYPTALDPERRARLDRIADRVLADDPALKSGDMEPRVRAGCTGGPALLFENRLAISLVGELRAEPLFDYRSLLLAGDDDLVVVDGERRPGFEAYCRHTLKLGRPDVVRAPQPGESPTPLTERCLNDPGFMEMAVERAHDAGALTVMPYIGTPDAWKLAIALAERSSLPVRVAAAPPRLTERVNDKLWFAERVTEVFPERQTPRTYPVHGPESLEGHLDLVIRRAGAVVVKIPNSAGALGNIILDRESLDEWGASALREHVVRTFGERGWDRRYPIALSVWEAPVMSSPSVQLWIDPDAGPPIVEGIFRQTVEADGSAFVGAAPARLPGWLCERIGDGALQLGYLLGRLGYYGRCSLDAIVVGDDAGGADVHWIECNGRWGGVSIPLTLANRMVGAWTRRPFVIVQSERRIRPIEFGTCLARVEGELFRTGTRERGVAFLTPRPFEAGEGLHFMALADGLDEAVELSRSASAILGDAIAAERR